MICEFDWKELNNALSLVTLIDNIPISKLEIVESQYDTVTITVRFGSGSDMTQETECRSMDEIVDIFEYVASSRDKLIGIELEISQTSNSRQCLVHDISKIANGMISLGRPVVTGDIGRQLCYNIYNGSPIMLISRALLDEVSFLEEDIVSEYNGNLVIKYNDYTAQLLRLSNIDIKYGIAVNQYIAFVLYEVTRRRNEYRIFVGDL